MRSFLLAALIIAAHPMAPALAGDSTRLWLEPREEWDEIAETVNADNDRWADSSPDPLTAPMEICQAVGCREIDRQTLNADEASRLRSLFAGPDQGAKAERTRIGRAIALLETVMGARNGTWRDLAGNGREAPGEPGQLDCIAESVNTRTYLDRLGRAGLLRHHRIEGYVHRYTVMLQHIAVAVIADGDEVQRFVVDSWVGANGEEPEILPYDDWRWKWDV